MDSRISLELRDGTGGAAAVSGGESTEREKNQVLERNLKHASVDRHVLNLLG